MERQRDHPGPNTVNDGFLIVGFGVHIEKERR
jgi:hypothetical protein